MSGVEVNSTTEKVFLQILTTEIPDSNSASLTYILIPLTVMASIILLAIMVYYMASRRRKYLNLRYVPNYSFDGSDVEEDEENYIETEHLLRSKLCIVDVIKLNLLPSYI